MNRVVRRFGAFAGVGLLAAAAGLLALRARAAGVPAANALAYTGYLETPDGAPVTHSIEVSVAIWSAVSGGTKLCQSDAANATPVAGRFQLTLPQACTQAVRMQPDLWLETTVDGTKLGRTKLGAVPFALEANHATTADSASSADTAEAAGGELKATLDSLTQKVSSVALRHVKGFSIPAEGFVLIPYLEELDELDEYSDNTFRPSQAGDYLFCGSLYVGVPDLNFEIDLFIDGSRANALGNSSGPYSATSGCAVHRLSAGQEVDVRVHLSGGTATVITDDNWDWLTITRLR
jgi:hypothetical protein